MAPPGPAPAAAGDVWCTCAPGIPFAAEASSVDCVVVARHHHAHHTAAAMGSGRRGEAERRHREVIESLLVFFFVHAKNLTTISLLRGQIQSLFITRTDVFLHNSD